MAPRDDLHAIFDAERQLREAEARLLARRDKGALAKELSEAVDEASGFSDREEALLRLERLADLCAQVPGPEMVDALIRILNDDAHSVRVAAGEALLDVAYERYAEVARAIERVLASDTQGPALLELPFVLAEVGEPSALSLIRRFLQHEQADVVAAGIEALTQLGEPEAVEDLQKLADDERTVHVEDFEQETRSTVGELAREAIDLLS